MPPDQAEDEKQLLIRTAEGDESALKLLIENYAGHLLTYISGLTKDREAAEEIVQDIFIKVWNARNYLLHVKDFKSWIFILSRNQALNAIDKALTLKRNYEKYKRFESIEEDKLAYEQWMNLIDKAIERLPAQQFRVWTMSRKQRKSYEEIAVELGISKETVKSYIKLATASITQFIKENAGNSLLVLFFWIFIKKS